VAYITEWSDTSHVWAVTEYPRRALDWTTTEWSAIAHDSTIAELFGSVCGRVITKWQWMELDMEWPDRALYRASTAYPGKHYKKY
jgi:hypothetical protein